jgi:hypothetical protein
MQTAGIPKHLRVASDRKGKAEYPRRAEEQLGMPFAVEKETSFGELRRRGDHFF